MVRDIETQTVSQFAASASVKTRIRIWIRTGLDGEKEGYLGSAGHGMRKRIVMKSSNKRDDYDVTLASGALIIPDLQPVTSLISAELGINLGREATNYLQPCNFISDPNWDHICQVGRL